MSGNLSLSVHEIFKRGLKQSLHVSWMLLKIYIPLSLLTMLLKRVGFIDLIAPFFAPVMKLMGLPGETAITLIAGGINNVYAALGTLAAFDLSFRQITILAVVIGLSHNLIVETAILLKLQMARISIVLFRIVTGILTGVILNTLLPQNISGVVLNPYQHISKFSWFKAFRSLGITAVQILVVMTVIMIGYEFLKSWRMSRYVKKKVRPISTIMGFSENALGAWFIGFFVGIAYGAGILFQFAEEHRLTHKDICLTTLFLCLAHAIIEDSMMFVIVGGNFWIIVLTRIILAFAIIRILAINGLYKYFLWIGLPEEQQ